MAKFGPGNVSIILLWLVLVGCPNPETPQPKSTNANLSALTILAGDQTLSISPAFSSETLSYTSNDVSSQTEQVTILATTADLGATVTGDGVRSLVVGNNTLSVTVTAASGNTRVYLIQIKKMGSMLAPVFEPVSGSLLNANTPITISSGTPGATIRYTIGDGSQADPTTTYGTVYSSAAKPQISLGNTVLKAIAYKADFEPSDLVQAQYTLMSEDAYLDTLSLTVGGSPVALTPTFSPGTTSYFAIVANAVTSLTISATPQDPQATVSGTGVKTGLLVGANNFNVEVTAEDGITTLTYTLTVTRADVGASTNADLTNLTLSAGTLSPGFTSGTTSYTASVDYDVGTITLTATKADAGATISGDGVRALVVGENSLTVTVTAAAGNTKTYTVTVTRAIPPQGAVTVTITLQAAPSEPALNWTLGGTFSGTYVNNTLTITKGQAPMTVAVAPVSGTIGNLRWRINGAQIHTGNNLSLDPDDVPLGPQQLVLWFEQNGRQYSQSLRITVRN